MEDYIRLFMNKKEDEELDLTSFIYEKEKNKNNRKCQNKNCCKACKFEINPNDYVLKIQQNYLYHMNCFVCVECNKLIQPGEKYGLINDDLFCCQHYLKNFKTGIILLDYF
jgi:hypothetical protein